MTEKFTDQSRPLKGQRVLVTRAREQASGFAGQLRALGAEVIEFPVIKIVEPEDYTALDSALARLSDFSRLIFTSANAVDYFFRRFNATLPASLKVCAIGPATASACQRWAVEPDLVPPKAVAESVVEALGAVRGSQILFPAADLARDALVDGLTANGARVERVTVYRTVLAGDEPGTLAVAQLVQMLESGLIDFATFTASSTVKNLAARLATASSKSFAQLLVKTVVACIGPITAATARELGLNVQLEAGEFTTEKLAAELVQYCKLIKP